MQYKINHYAYVLDQSGSMRWLERKLREFTTEQLNSHRELASQYPDQETRVSLYYFSDDVTRKYADRSAVAAKFESFNPYWGNTALYDAIGAAVTDFEKVNTKDGNDHAFFVVVQTDGQNNRQIAWTAESIRGLMTRINRRDDFTVSVMVPDTRGFSTMRSLGVPEGNITIWETSERGIERATVQNIGSTQAIYAARSTGVKKSVKYFDPNATFLVKDLKASGAKPLPASKFQLHVVKDPGTVEKKRQISQVVEALTKKPYVTGSAYYLLSKPEKIQAQKKLIVIDNVTGKAYQGDGVRGLVGLPDYEVKVNPASHGKWNIFVQSTSTNRLLYPGSQILVVK